MSWTVTKIDEVTGDKLYQVDLSKNLYSTMSEINIDKYSIESGLYIFNLTLDLIYTTGTNQTKLTDWASAFIYVNPEIVIVLGLKNGANQITIGTYQSLIMSPNNFSYLSGTPNLPSHIDFKFYCRILDLNQNNFDVFIQIKLILQV